MEKTERSNLSSKLCAMSAIAYTSSRLDAVHPYGRKACAPTI
jgi:hypothetical protein